MAPTIGLLGDVMLGRGVARELASTPPAELWSSELRELAARCDLLVANLECCISARGRRTRRVPGKPFFFRAPPLAVDALGAIGAGAVSLANNHALDYEADALTDTLDHLAAAGIAVVGAGRGAAQARRGLALEGAGARVGVVAVSDHPGAYAARDGEPGIAYADLRRAAPAWLREEVRALRERCDLVMAFPHWGPNMTVCPAPWQRERAAELLAAGCDLVAGHSAHVFHGVELCSGGAVLYDLGDAIDDYARDAKLRNDLGVLALWRPGGAPELELVGLRLEFARTGLARGADADWVATRLEDACAELGTTVRRLDEQRFEVVPAGRAQAGLASGT